MNLRLGLVLALVVSAAPAARADAPPSRYTVKGDGTIKDNQTGLVWQRVAATTGGQENDGRYAHMSALSYCKNTSTLPGAGWRAPTLKELMTLVDVRRSNPAIDPAFTLQPGYDYWSSTKIAGDGSLAWIVNFQDGGSTDFVSASSDHRILCVK